ncbi:MULTISPECIES: hypothetical protein [unclassified Caballeronia]|uniref:hypothetical protein n=1 Tax=unclassified Caballeronia TaxID=2646786 RepID=UPI002861D6FF|nr:MULTISPECIES: hypothetical protein [unclassified Caballeronia]MDR5754998.1 hypothetical protein [Caballeronia sp. LZ024]MDR5845560.1 hypothetical protein [Caballeronia sp. LZ031]
MRDQNESARRFDTFEGHALVDYFTVHLPVQLLAIDVIGLDRRPLPAPIEFCLRVIDSGLFEGGDICAFLGVDATYGESLLQSLCDGDYIGKNAFGHHVLLRRGKEALRENGESSPSDRRIYLLWDSIQKSLLERTIVYTKQRADPSGITAPISNAFALPQLSELDVGEINKLRTTTSSPLESTAPGFEVLRVTKIHKSLGRFRPALALIYRASSGELSLRLAVNGSIDNELTTACAQVGLAKLIGVERGFANKAGGQAIRKRYRDLVSGSEGGPNVASLVQRRSVLLFNLGAVEMRLGEERSDSLLEKKARYEAELETVSKELNRIPVVPVRCHEGEYYLASALDNSEVSMEITTTNPSLSKIDGDVLRRIRSCLARGVQITIYISDRLGENDPTLAALDKLSREHSLTVRFLLNDVRSIFEITWDGKHLLVSNEPPLGDRRRPVSPREFSGFYVSEQRAVEHYCHDHMKFETKDFLSRLTPQSLPAKTAARDRWKFRDR